MGRIFAAADIGSNTAHLLIAETQKKGLKRLTNESDWLSLGEVVSRQGFIPPDSETRLFDSLRRFKILSDLASVEQMYVFATEAVRKASNCDDVVARIKKEIGMTVDIITPAREAELGFRGAQIDTEASPQTLMIEMGGGSVQAAWAMDGKVVEDISLPIGTGALIASCNLEQPANGVKVRQVQDVIRQAISVLDFDRHASHIVAVGGVARGIWRAMHPDKSRRLHLEEMKFLAWDAARLTPNVICKRYGVKVKRAATLLPGALVYSALLERYGREELEVSQYGVREGAILEMAQGLG